MGLVKGLKVENMRHAAASAYARGDRFFTPMMNFPTWRLRVGLSGPVDPWPPVLSAIIAEGWRLHTWHVAADKQGRPQAMPLFERA